MSSALLQFVSISHLSMYLRNYLPTYPSIYLNNICVYSSLFEKYHFEKQHFLK